MYFCKQAFSFCPITVPPACGINCEGAESRCAYFSFYRWTNNEGTDTNRELTQFNVRFIGSDGIICSSSETNTTSNTFTLNACNDKFRTLAHSIDDIRK